MLSTETAEYVTFIENIPKQVQDLQTLTDLENQGANANTIITT